MSRNARKGRRKRKRKTNSRRKTKNTTKISAPRAFGSILRNTNALSKLRFQHREFVEDINVTEASNVQTKYEVNPGLETTFPWLSGIATMFETYVFHSLKFHYCSSTSTGISGSMVLVPDYDASDNNVGITKSRLLSFEDTVRGNLWTSFTMNCSKKNLGTLQKYVRNGPVPTSTDVKLYDVMQLITSKSAVASHIAGELWVEYDITLFTPQNTPEPVQRLEFDFISTESASVTNRVVNNNTIGAEWQSTEHVSVSEPGIYEVTINHDPNATDVGAIEDTGDDALDIYMSMGLLPDGRPYETNGTLLTEVFGILDDLYSYVVKYYWIIPVVKEFYNGVHGLRFLVRTKSTNAFNGGSCTMTRIDEAENASLIARLKRRYKAVSGPKDVCLKSDVIVKPVEKYVDPDDLPEESDEVRELKRKLMLLQK